MLRTVALLVLLASAASVRATEPPPRYADRWVYVMYNLQVDASADEVIKLIDRSAKAGYTGLVLADFTASGQASRRRTLTRASSSIRQPSTQIVPRNPPQTPR